MKKNLISCALALTISSVAFQANAADYLGLNFTPDTTRIVSDPSYLPMQGQVYGSTSYSYGEKISHSQYAGFSLLSNNAKNMTTQQINYGVTNDIMIGVSDSYNWSKDTQRLDGFKGSQESNGFTDPSIHATWRALDQKAAPLNLDIFGSYAPDVIGARVATFYSDGRAAQGGQVASFGSAISYETKSFTAYGSASASYLGERKVDNFDGNDHDDSHWQYALALNTQTRLCNHFSVNLGAAEIFNTDENGVNNASHQDFTFSGANETNLNAAFNYHIIPNKLVASITYDYNMYENQNHIDAGQLTDYTHDNSENVIGVRLQYVFN